MSKTICRTKSGPLFAAGRAVALAMLVSSQGCSLITGGDCAGVGHYGVIATVLDARTQAPPASPAKVTLREGAFVEVLAVPNLGPGVYGGASDREGVYSLTVEAAGFQTFVQQDVAVRGRSCGEVTTNSVAVQLIAAP
ncbi:MAG: hypothetical protein JWL61_2324 [Gemmatimonadetes bacterium]|nr:hypothetical protein [Gemmatimonadota bacterium]